MPAPRSVLIHTGLHKCASSYLQANVFPRLDAHYLKVGNYPDAGAAFLDELRFTTEFSPVEFARRMERHCGVRAEDNLPLVLSHEGLSGPPHGGTAWDAERVARRLHSMYPDARILLIVRNQFDYMLSLYAYRVCVNGLRWQSVQAFLEETIANGLREKLCYDRLVSMYHTVFSAARVLVLPVEMLSCDEASFLARICAFAGVAVPAAVSSVERGRVNASSRSNRVLTICRIANIMTSGLVASMRVLHCRAGAEALRNRYMYSRRTFMLPVLSRFAGSRLLALPECIQASCEDNFSASNKRLVDLTGMPFADYKYIIKES